MDLVYYDVLAKLFDHPEPGYLDRVDEACVVLAERNPEAERDLQKFRAFLPDLDLDELQQLYVRTFEVQAIVTLDVGYMIFGDDYKRGALLANLNGEHRRANNDCATELADHLPNVLRLLPRLRDEELLEELVTELVAPAVRRMVGEFEERQLAQKDLLYRKHYRTVIDSEAATRTIYCFALEALYKVLHQDFTIKTLPIVEQTSEFLRGVGTEIKTEACAECPQGQTQTQAQTPSQ